MTNLFLNILMKAVVRSRMSNSKLCEKNDVAPIAKKTDQKFWMHSDRTVDFSNTLKRSYSKMTVFDYITVSMLGQKHGFSLSKNGLNQWFLFSYL